MYNQTGDKGAIAIAKALKKNSFLQEINLALNKIGDEGAMAIAIAQALKTNSKLQEINLNHNKISDEGAISIK